MGAERPGCGLCSLQVRELSQLEDQNPLAVAMGLVTLALSIAAPRPRPSFIVSHRTEARLPHSSFGRWAVSEVDCFIANSQALAARLRKDGVPVGRAVTVHEGIDVDRVQRLEPANVQPQTLTSRNRFEGTSYSGWLTTTSWRGTGEMP